MILTSKNNPLVKETASLKEKKGRKELGLFLVEGVKMSKECQISGFEIDRIFLSENYTGETFDEQKTVRVSQDVLKVLSDEKTPQGVVCRVKIPEKTLKKPTGKCLILDGVSDPANMGAIIRTANAAGYKEITLLGQNVNSYNKELSEDKRFPALLKAISEIEGDFIIRFMISVLFTGTNQFILDFCFTFILFI